MDPNNHRGPDAYGDQGHPARESDGGGPPQAHEAATSGYGGQQTPPGGPARTVQLISGDYLLTVNPVDGSEIEPCPPGGQPRQPERHSPEAREERRRAAAPPVPPGPAGPELPLLERGEERERLLRLLGRGRSVRLTGPSGSGRSVLLDALAADCAGLAPDGVIRLSGYHRTPTDLLHELHAAVFDSPLHRLDRPQLLETLHRIGAVVVLDDLEFGGSGLEELLDATPECAFLISATPEVAPPSVDSHLEEVFLAGLSRTGCLELLERAAHRPLAEDEARWAADLWFESEGLPLRFVQAAALLRQRDELRADPETFDEDGVYADQPYDLPFDAGDPHDVPLPTLAEGAAPAALLASRLTGAARDTLRFAVALGGECPHQAHLPALAGDTHADAALGELLGCGLVTPVGTHYRLAAGVAGQLAGTEYADDAGERARAAAQHYAWWAGHPSVTPERAAAESDAVLAAMGALLSRPGDLTAGHPSAAVLLARTAAPAFAAALHWSAWERALRSGQEAARLSGEVAEEAYFHHELGVLALCAGHLERARAELEASIALRGALADRRGAIAGRRALALVEDRSGGFVQEPLAAAVGEEVPDARNEESASPPGGVPAAFAFPPLDPSEGTVVTRLGADGSASGRTEGGKAAAGRKAGAGSVGKRALLITGARRNMVAAGAGALLAAVLGTVVTLGAMSDSPDDQAPGGKVKSEQSAEEGRGGDGLTADEPAQDSTARPGPGRSVAPGDSGKPSSSPSKSPDASDSADPDDSGTPSDDPTGPSDKPTEPTAEPTKPTDKPTKPTTSPTKPPTKPPTDPPTDPTDPPTDPTDNP
ncbi:ATP-binding protein, partial [Streptomyces sp. H27-D2]|uniref:ATP-binding protein n=1 Tax=Streptomyces sp. H27-D2 TaxID=3046304 RepID=UPI002DBF8D70